MGSFVLRVEVDSSLKGGPFVPEAFKRVEIYIIFIWNCHFKGLPVPNNPNQVSYITHFQRILQIQTNDKPYEAFKRDNIFCRYLEGYIMKMRENEKTLCSAGPLLSLYLTLLSIPRNNK